MAVCALPDSVKVSRPALPSDCVNPLSVATVARPLYWGPPLAFTRKTRTCWSCKLALGLVIFRVTAYCVAGHKVDDGSLAPLTQPQLLFRELAV